MKILWVKTDFLHPTDRGGQIRTLEIIKRLHQRHEVHYIAYNQPRHPDALGRSGEYCAKAYPVELEIPARGSLKFAAQLGANLFSDLPLAVSRYCSPAMRACIADVLGRTQFESIVCDFLFPAPNFADLKRCVLFQHNVESQIWERHARTAADPLRRAYFGMQARRMFNCERSACLAAARIVAVSSDDACVMQRNYGCDRISVIPTGVDIEYFAPKPAAPAADLVFLGSMDWMPNIDAMRYFFGEIWPLVRANRPTTTVAIVGRKPPPEIVALGKQAGVTVTGTVPDVRPYLWGSRVSIVPLRIGSGTRLKIYEAVAAGLPVVSTTIGAEGLGLCDPEEIRLADTPERFAEACVALLDNPAMHATVRQASWNKIAGCYSWERVTDEFEAALEAARA